MIDQGDEEDEHADAEEGDRFVGRGTGQADAVLGQRCRGGDAHQGEEGKEGYGGPLHGRESIATAGAVGPAAGGRSSSPAISARLPQFRGVRPVKIL